MQRFWKKVSKTESCWLWTGAVMRRYYGMFTLNGKAISPQRFTWMEAHGAIPEGKVLVRKSECHNPLCCNPDHYQIGTRSDAARARYIRKPNNAREPVNIARLREAYATGEYSQRELAELLGCSQSLVSTLISEGKLE